MLEEGICHTEVAFGVLKINGVDFVRHRTGPHFAFLDALLETIDADVSPDIAAEINQDVVDALEGIGPGGELVVVLNLGGQRASDQTELPRHKPLPKRRPVHRRVGGEVRIEAARRPAKLRRKRHPIKRLELPIEAVDEHRPLLAEGDRAGRLAVGPGEERNVAPGAGLLGELSAQSIEGWPDDVTGDTL